MINIYVYKGWLEISFVEFSSLGITYRILVTPSFGDWPERLWGEDHKYGNTLGERNSHPTWVTEWRLFILWYFHCPQTKIIIQCLLRPKKKEKKRTRGQRVSETFFSGRSNIRRNISLGTPFFDYIEVGRRTLDTSLNFRLRLSPLGTLLKSEFPVNHRRNILWDLVSTGRFDVD